MYSTWLYWSKILKSFVPTNRFRYPRIPNLSFSVFFSPFSPSYKSTPINILKLLPHFHYLYSHPIRFGALRYRNFFLVPTVFLIFPFYPVKIHSLEVTPNGNEQQSRGRMRHNDAGLVCGRFTSHNHKPKTPNRNSHPKKKKKKNRRKSLC